MRTVSFYKWSQKISITAHCDKYAVSENNILYFISIVGPDSAVRGIISAIHTGESIRILSEEEYVNCKKGISPLRSFTTKLSYEGFTHGVCLDTSAWEIDQRNEVFLLQNTPEAIYAILHKNFAITAIPEWKKWLYQRLNEYIVPLRCYGMDACVLKITEEELDKIISEGCRSGEIRFTKTFVPGISALETIDGVDSYLQKFGTELAEKIHTAFRPLYLPENQEWSKRIHSLFRKPFQAQGDAIMGAVETLKTQKSLNIVGEMGVGKSLIGAAIPYVCSQTPCRTLIVCPGHLVHKWADEVKRTIPSSQTFIVRKFGDLIPLLTLKKTKPLCYEWYFISKDKSKLSFFWKSAVVVKKETCFCPECGVALKDKDGWPVPPSYFDQSKRYCPECHSPLWEADRSKIRRFAPAEFIKKYLKWFFLYAVFDEVHELKGGTTAQGNVLGILASCVKKVITMTGTLASGYSDDMYFVLFRTAPGLMRNEGFSWSDVQKWTQMYGVLERITKVQKDGEDNSASRGSKKRETVRRRPGISPLVYSKFLLGNTVFLQLDDISDKLPGITETVVGVKMDTALQKAYDLLEQTIGSRVKQEMAATGNSSLLGTYLLSLLAYVDRPYKFGPILHPSAKKELPPEYFLSDDKELFLMEHPDLIDSEDIIVMPPDLPEDVVYPKEKALLEIVEKEIAQHRRCFVFAIFTNSRDVTPRIESLLTKKNIKTVTLKSSVLPETRMDWVNEKVSQGFQVIISNPELVKTGLDLLDFPTIIFFQSGYNTFTIRQSSRRSWRIGQTNEVKIFYLFYQSSMQEQCLRLMGSKMEASIGIEGKFSEEGLIAMSSGDDMMNALAKTIVGKIGNTDTAENIWKRMAEKTRSNKARSVEEAPSISIPQPIKVSPSTTQDQIMVVEIVKVQGKKRIVERLEGSEEEIRKLMQAKRQPAQLLLF